MAIIYEDVGKGKEMERSSGVKSTTIDKQRQRGRKCFTWNNLVFFGFRLFLFFDCFGVFRLSLSAVCFVFRLSSFLCSFLYDSDIREGTTTALSICSQFVQMFHVKHFCLPLAIPFTLFPFPHIMRTLSPVPFWFSITELFLFPSQQHNRVQSIIPHALKLFHVKHFPASSSPPSLLPVFTSKLSLLSHIFPSSPSILSLLSPPLFPSPVILFLYINALYYTYLLLLFIY